MPAISEEKKEKKHPRDSDFNEVKRVLDEVNKLLTLEHVIIAEIREIKSASNSLENTIINWKTRDRLYDIDQRQNKKEVKKE